MSDTDGSVLEFVVALTDAEIRASRNRTRRVMAMLAAMPVGMLIAGYLTGEHGLLLGGVVTGGAILVLFVRMHRLTRRLRQNTAGQAGGGPYRDGEHPERRPSAYRLDAAGFSTRGGVITGDYPWNTVRAVDLKSDPITILADGAGGRVLHQIPRRVFDPVTLAQFQMLIEQAHPKFIGPERKVGKQVWKTIGLWAVLIMMFLAAYNVFTNGEPTPTTPAASRPTPARTR